MPGKAISPWVGRVSSHKNTCLGSGGWIPILGAWGVDSRSFSCLGRPYPPGKGYQPQHHMTGCPVPPTFGRGYPVPPNAPFPAALSSTLTLVILPLYTLSFTFIRACVMYRPVFLFSTLSTLSTHSRHSQHSRIPCVPCPRHAGAGSQWLRPEIERHSRHSRIPCVPCSRHAGAEPRSAATPVDF